MALPPDRDPNHELLTIAIDNSLLDKGDHTVVVKDFSVDQFDSQDIVFTDGGPAPITDLYIQSFGDDDSEEDVFRFDLSTFNDTFDISFSHDEAVDVVIIEGIDSVVDNGGGNYTITYTGSDLATHTVTLDAGTMQTQFYNDAVDGTAGNDTMGIGFTDIHGDIIDGADGNDETIEGYAGNDTINAGAGDDYVLGGDDADTFVLTDGFGDDVIFGGEGGTDNDTINATALTSGVTVTLTDEEEGTLTNGGDTVTFSEIEAFDLTGSNDTFDASLSEDAVDVDGGGGIDNITGSRGDDTIDGEGGADILDGGGGDDTISGGAGADTITGGADQAAVPTARGVFKWDAIPDPDDGGVIDNGDQILTATQSVSGVDVTFTAAAGDAEFSNELQHTAGINAGSGTVDANSAGILASDGTTTLTFSEAVENISFRVNDFEDEEESLVIRVYDASNNQIAFTATQGADVLGWDTDAVAGNDWFEAAEDAGATPSDPGGSLRIDIAGPAARIELELDRQDSFTLQVTDVFFDIPNSAIASALGGDDDLFGNGGNDTFQISNGTDTIDGGTGTDTYTAAAGSVSNETITVVVDNTGGGTVQKANTGTTDTVTSVETYVAAEAGAENDTITVTGTQLKSSATNFDNTAVGTYTPKEGGGPYNFGGGGEPTINDILNGTFDPGSGPVSGSGTFAITSGEENGASVGGITFQNFENINFQLVCFARGTNIETSDGQVAIENLGVGDMVRTADRGYQPIRWIGSTRVLAKGRHAPIRIREGVFGNARDLLVSPQHRMVLEGWQMELLFAEHETLATAKSLINDQTILREPGGVVEYFHILFDTHEIIFAEGAPSESFHPGILGMGSLEKEVRAEIFDLFPELRANVKAYGPSARLSLKAYEARLAAKALPLFA